MHTTTGEVKSITVMSGGTAEKYSRDNLTTLAVWELKYNGRYGELLQQYRSGVLVESFNSFLILCLWGCHVAIICTPVVPLLCMTMRIVHGPFMPCIATTMHP